MLLSICREFNVNEEWLRNETGEMFIELSSYEKTYNHFGYIMENATPSKKSSLIYFIRNAVQCSRRTVEYDDEAV